MNRFIAFLMVGALLFSGAADAQTAKKSQQIMQYDVYAGGIHALQSKLDINLSAGDTYNIALEAKTYGLLGKLAPWQGVFKTMGWKTDKNLQPEIHTATTTWRDDDEVKSYTYKKDGSFVEYSKKEGTAKAKPKAVDTKLTQGTTDVLTATLSALQGVAVNNKCEGSSEIFDGKRRFKLIFKEKRKVMLEASRYNAYSGSAIECSAEVQPVAGKWREKPRGWMSIQEQGREKGTMPTVWFASVSEGQPAVPVKVRVKTDYGTLFMHMTQYETQGKKLTLK